MSPEMMNMKVLFIVLNSEEHIDDLLIKFDSSGILGSTIIYELIGPMVAKYALTKSGQIQGQH